MRGAKLWRVERVELSSEAKRLGINRVSYPFHVQGVYLPAAGECAGRSFFWQVPDLRGPGYDLSGVDIPDAWLALVDVRVRHAVRGGAA